MRGEEGHTLVELLVAAAIGLLVAAGGMVLLQIAIRTQPASSERSAQIQEGRAMIERITRELRQGETVSTAAANQLQIKTWVSSQTCGGEHATTSILCTVTYTCQDGTCERTEWDGSGGGATTQVVSGLLESDVFTYCERGAYPCEPAPTSSNPGYVQVSLAYPQDAGESVTVSDGIALRNFIEEPPES